MAQDQNDDNDNPEPTLAVVKQQQKERIGQLRKSNAGERRLAKLLTRCREGNRCNLLECLVCERRKERARWRVPSSVVKSFIGTKCPKEVYLKYIEVVGKRRALSEKKVSALAASMDQIGQQMPITVRMHKKQILLVAGLHRLAAAERLGWNSILSVELSGDNTEARLWQLMENFCRADLRILERAEQLDELRTLIWTKSEEGQVAPPGGRQPKDVGLKKTAKKLGVAREEIRRAKAIAAISPNAKNAAKAARLDNSQRALLEIAKQPTASAQLKVVDEIIELRRAERARHKSAAEQKAAAELAALKTGLVKDKRTRESLEAKIADTRQRLRELKDAAPATVEAEFATCPVIHLRAPGQASLASDPALDVEKLIDQHAAEVEDCHRRIQELENELSTVRQNVPAPSAETGNLAADFGDLPIPPFLLRRALSEDEQRQVDNLERVWANASSLVRQRFLEKYARSDVGGNVLHYGPGP